MNRADPNWAHFWKMNYFRNDYSVNLGNKEHFDKEQIGDKNHFPWPNANLLHKDKEHLALRNNFRVTKKFLITKFDSINLEVRKVNIFLPSVKVIAVATRSLHDKKSKML